MQILHGIGVCEGIALAKAALFHTQTLQIDHAPASDISHEKETFHQSFLAVRNTIARRAEGANLQAEIFQTHLMILDDSSLAGSILEKIDNGKNAAWAIDEALTELADIFAAMDDPYMSARSDDIKDLKAQLLQQLLGIKKRSLLSLPEGCILIAEDLAPSDTIGLDPARIAGIVCAHASQTSHVSIIAKNLEIPTVVACAEILSVLNDGTLLAIDGKSGEVLIHPDDAACKKYLAEQAHIRALHDQLLTYTDTQVCTIDGHTVFVEANIGSDAEAALAKKAGAQQVGLFRSEFLYMAGNTLPDEETQRSAYASAASCFAPRHVVIRTLDIGGDKDLPALALPHEDNPFLGLRAIRLCMQHKDLFLLQLRALLQAGLSGNIKVLLPMITTLDELRTAKQYMVEAAQQLDSENIPHCNTLPVGVMIETPAAVAMAEELAKEADFFSIGTNDLMQYTMCADRGNAGVAYLYAVSQPPVLRMIAHAIHAAKRGDIPCAMCGEAASDALFAPVWLGLGLDEFSVNLSAVLKLKRQLCNLNYTQCQDLARQIFACATQDQVLTLLRQFQKELS